MFLCLSAKFFSTLNRRASSMYSGLPLTIRSPFIDSRSPISPQKRSVEWELSWSELSYIELPTFFDELLHSIHSLGEQWSSQHGHQLGAVRSAEQETEKEPANDEDLNGRSLHNSWQSVGCDYVNDVQEGSAECLQFHFDIRSLVSAPLPNGWGGQDADETVVEKGGKDQE